MNSLPSESRTPADQNEGLEESWPPRERSVRAAARAARRRTDIFDSDAERARVRACACAVRACLREAEQQRAEEKKASEKASTNEIGAVVSFFSFSVRGPPNELCHAPPSTRCAAHKRPRAKKKETLASHGSLVSVPPFYTNTFSFQRDGPGRDVLHACLVRHQEAR